MLMPAQSLITVLLALSALLNHPIHTAPVKARVLGTNVPLSPAPTLTVVQTPKATPTPKPVVAPPAPTPAPSISTDINPQNLLQALNNYRIANGKSALSWDNNLAGFAQTRARHFLDIGGLDNHAGFLDFIQNQDGFHKLGFMSLGENSGEGYLGTARGMVEQFYTQDQGHKDNELNPKWSYAGIAVLGKFTDFIFAGSKI